LSIGSAADSIAAFAAVAAVCMAAWTVLESRRLREATTSPEVVVYLARNDRFRNSLDLIVHNIGTAPAYLVKFEIKGNPIPFGWWEQDQIYILTNGINFFPPGQLFRFSINEYKNVPKDEVTIDVCYFAKGEADQKPCRRESFTLRPLEFGSFAEWTDWEKEANRATKDGMKELIRTLGALQAGTIKIGVRPEPVKEPRPPFEPVTHEDWQRAWDSLDWNEFPEGNDEPEEPT
jgi:hypothetical protein